MQRNRAQLTAGAPSARGAVRRGAAPVRLSSARAPAAASPAAFSIAPRRGRRCSRMYRCGSCPASLAQGRALRSLAAHCARHSQRQQRMLHRCRCVGRSSASADASGVSVLGPCVGGAAGRRNARESTDASGSAHGHARSNRFDTLRRARPYSVTRLDFLASFVEQPRGSRAAAAAAARACSSDRVALAHAF